MRRTTLLLSSDLTKIDINLKDIQLENSKTGTAENKCEDCYKIMKSMKSLIDHKKKFRCPGNKFEPIKQTGLKAKTSLSKEKATKDDLEPEDSSRPVQIHEEQINIKSNEFATETPQLKCSDCESKFSHAKTLKEHIKKGRCKNGILNGKSNADSHECGKCERKFKFK